MRKTALIAWFCFLAFATLASDGCRDKAAPGTAGVGGTPAPAAPAAIDWSKVRSAGDIHVVGPALFHLARLADAWTKGAPTTMLRCTGESVTDGAGHSAPITKEEWKAFIGIIDATPDHKTAIRALPGTSGGYHDGLGTLPRYAYYVQHTPDNAIVLTLAKPLGDSSSE